MRAATVFAYRAKKRFVISIHAAHAGSDYNSIVYYNKELKISIHAAHAGSDYNF